jgi:TadE-like protein
VKRLLEKLRRQLRGRDTGTVTLTFAFCLPILLLLIGVLVQFALLINARLTLQRAVQAGARSAMTSLPTDQNIGDPGGAAFVGRSIRMTLESLSPASPDAATGEAQSVADALQQLGATLPNQYVQRYTYGQEAAVIQITPIDANGAEVAVTDFSKVAAPRVRLTVQYQFQLTVPVVRAAIGQLGTVGGINGRFITLTSSLDVQLSPGREGVIP